MSPPSCTIASGAGFPRVSGDEPLVTAQLTREDEFSPRERG